MPTRSAGRKSTTTASTAARRNRKSQVVIDLQLEIGPVFQNMAPSAEQIPSRDLAMLLNNGSRDGGVSRDGKAFPDAAFVKIALQRQRVRALQVPVHPEAALSHLPVV